MTPIISIIIPTYNRRETIETAIQSVFAQWIDDLEFLIMDGGSTDNTEQIVNQYPGVQFYSEPDEGLYFALNKGLKIAQGKYISWLNSDDYLKPGVLRGMIDELEKDPSLMAVFASAEISPDRVGKSSVLVPSIKPGQLIQHVTRDGFSLNAMVFRKIVFDTLGGFDTRYKISADRDFLFRFALSGMSFKSIDDVLYVYQSQPTSLTYGNQMESKLQANLEEMQMAAEYWKGISSLCVDPEMCKSWHSRASADGTILLLFNGKIARAIKMALAGINVDKGWFSVFLKLFILELSRKIFSQRFRSKFSRYRHFLTGVK